eukprot:357308-Chlamydomonas_euryale.AAC.5
MDPWKGIYKVRRTCVFPHASSRSPAVLACAAALLRPQHLSRPACCCVCCGVVDAAHAYVART